MCNRTIDKNFFPGWVRKSVTFTIDDGNVPMDKKFLDIMRPAGILGTFNLCSHNLGYMSRDEYREFYRGYGIANHGKYHAVTFPEGLEYTVTDEPFDKYTSDEKLVYHHPTADGAYMCHFNLRHPELPPKTKPQGWACTASADVYCRLAEESRAELCDFFGEDAARGYVYPGGKSNAIAAVGAIRELGYFYVRRTGCLLDTTGFSMPADRGDWTYNANHMNLLEVMEKYESFPDSGELKMFSFGVHSVDFETADKWDDLARFAELYGSRPDSYYYASVEDIFDYEDALAALKISDDGLVNPSSVDLYVKIDGEPTVISANSTYKM